MPTPKLDLQFLEQYHQARPQDREPTPLCTPEQMLQGVTDIMSAIIMGRLPELSPEERDQMGGRLTPGGHELLLAAIPLLTDHPDIAREAGFGPEVFEHIARSDVELENLGTTFNDLVISLGIAEGQQQGALLAFNSHVLLVVQQMLDELSAPEQQQAHDTLLAKFRKAMDRQMEIAQERSQQSSGKDQSDRPSQKVLKEQLAEAAKVAGVRHAVATIQSVGRKLDQSGTPPLLTATEK